MKSATVSTKGRVSIPAEFRQKYEIKPGTRIVFGQKNNTIEMRAITPAYIDSFRGILKSKPGEKPMTQELVEEHAAEVVRDESGFC